jgi:nucleotide-binding universal stress UspA family protein
MNPQIKKILYTTDLSKNASYAFIHAVDMAKRYNAKLVILHAIDPGRRISYPGSRIEEILKKSREEQQKTDFEDIKQGLREYCKKIEAQIGAPCVDLVSDILVPLGHPVEEILTAADKEGCDAIVLGTHGKGFLEHTFLGSVAGSVLERTRKPVYIIPLPSEKEKIDWDKI